MCNSATYHFNNDLNDKFFSIFENNNHFFGYFDLKIEYSTNKAKIDRVKCMTI